MKIVCESCGAKYSIADERITGKVFKIRCKRCSEVIIVRGDQQAPAADQPAAQPAAQESAGIWHIVVEGEQAGPYTPAQLGEMLSAGSVDWEAYVWTEGFDNWLPLRDVPDLVSQITGEGAPAPAAAVAPAAASRASTYRSAVQETLTGQPSMGADPFADDAPSDGGLFGGGAAAHAGPDLFARSQVQASASPYVGGADSGLMTSAASPRVEAAQAMTGARNENSVLFSLKNLQALATGGSGSAAASMPAAASLGGGREGYAGGEGSGLIDIRALATATGVSESAGGGSRDELLSIGAQGGAFGTLGSPMLAPAAAEDEGNKKVLVWAGVAAVGFISAAAVAIIYLTRAPAVTNASVGVGPAAMGAAALPAPGPAPAAQLPAPAPSEGELAAKAAGEAKPSTDSERGGSNRSSGSHHRTSRGDSSASGASDKPSEPIASADKPAPSKPSGPRSIDDLLDGALGGGSSAKPKAAAGGSEPKSNLPETPSREQVMSSMGAVKPAVSACAQGQGGIAMVNVSVAGETGRVTNATVSGVTGPTGSCVAQAVRKAQFPKFQNKVFKVQFPFKL